MLDFYLWANLLISVSILAIGLLVILKSNKAQLNRIFLWFCIFTSIWIVSNYLSNTKNLSSSAILVANHIVLFSSTLALFWLAQFTVFFTDNRFFMRYAGKSLVLNISVAFLTLTPLVVSGITIQKSASAIIFGPLGFLYFLLLAVNSLIIIISLATGIRRTRGEERRRIVTVAWSFLIMLAIVIILNAVIPLITGSFNSTNVGPLSVILLATGISYSIIRHKLFDIRSFVVRAAAYFLTFAIVSIIYIIPTVLLTTLLLHTPLKSGTLVALAILTLMTAILYQPVRYRFNKFTSRLFYRDYYEPQDVLDKISSLLVGSVDVREIEVESAKIIQSSLKPDYLSYLLKAEKIGDSRSNELLELLAKKRQKIVGFDDFNAHEHSALHRMMSDDSIALAIKLSTRHEELGFMTLGFRQSGSAYSKADQRLLGIVADELAVGLQNALRFEQIQQFNVTLQEKVTAATKELRRANVRLKELDATKDEFISMASHQLRTPLTTIKGYLSMILDGDVGKIKAEEKDLVQHAFDSAERMVYLIADLLNVSRLQSGKFVIDNKPTDLPKVVNEELQQLKEQAANRKITVNYTPPKEYPTLNLDETKIRQVIMNFLDNALYYTPPDGEVTVELAASDASASLTITDTGVGVPKDIQHHLFTKFYRADNARKMRPDGTGLGLYMAKKVVVAQGGAIIFKSVEGKGSTFGFSFPRASAEIKK